MKVHFHYVQNHRLVSNMNYSGFARRKRVPVLVTRTFLGPRESHDCHSHLFDLLRLRRMLPIMYPISLQHILVQTHWFFHVAHWQMPCLKKASSTVFMTLLSLIYILELCNFNYQINQLFS